MSDCVFCKIVRGEVPSTKIYENEKVLVLLDINPVSIGHTLVIPKVHYKDCLDTPDDVLQEIMKAIKKIAPALLKASHSEGFNIGVNTGTKAGQVIFHTHFHVIPRRHEDGLHLWKGKAYKEGEMASLGDAIRKLL